jgi:hypothetical protein
MSAGYTFHSTDREEVLVRRAHVAGADGLALEVLERCDAACLGGQQAHATAMDGGGDAHVKALFQRLEPAQRHADAGVGLAGRDRLQQLIRRAAEVDQLDGKVALLEVALGLRDGDADGADRAGVPGQPQVLARPLHHGERHLGRGVADRRRGDWIERCRQAAGRETSWADQPERESGACHAGGAQHGAAGRSCHGSTILDDCEMGGLVERSRNRASRGRGHQGSARQAADVVQRWPDGGIQLLQPEVDGDEAVAAVDPDGGANEHAIHVDDVRLQHRLVSFGSNGSDAVPTGTAATMLTGQLHRGAPR